MEIVTKRPNERAANSALSTDRAAGAKPAGVITSSSWVHAHGDIVAATPQKIDGIK